ncbi:MAG: hypothetical protein IKQ93_00820 [Candidatus Methanomethylophilaceae archaeon]|nr:hypothetical protein [Candidatus Methanomethylophilaceae archaeon]
MRKMQYLAVGVLILTVFISISFVSDDASADIEYTDKAIIIHDTEVLTDDLVFPDESNIIINLGTYLDINQYTIDFGKDSKVAILDDVTIACTTGKIVIREGTSLILVGAALPGQKYDLTITFDGKLTSDGTAVIKGATVTLDPNGEDRSLHLAWEQSKMSIEDPIVNYTVDTSGSDLKLGFTHLTYSEEYTMDTDISLTRELYLTSSDSNNSLEAVASTNKTFKMTINVSSLRYTKYVANSDMTTVLTMDGMGVMTVFVDSNLIMTVTSSAQDITYTNSIGDEVRRSAELTNVKFDMKADITVIAIIIEQEDLDPSDDPNIIKSMHITADTGDVMVTERRGVKHITDIAVTIDGSDKAETYFLATFMDGERYNEIRADKLIFKSFGLTNDLKLTMLAYVPQITYTAHGGEQQDVSLHVEELYVETDNLAVDTLLKQYYRAGELTAQQLLDNGKLFRIAVGTVLIDTDADKEIDTIAHDLEAKLAKNSRDSNTLVITFTDLTGPLHDDDDNIDYNVSMDASEVYMESDSSISEIIDAFTKRIHFSNDTNAEIQITTAGLTIDQIRETGNSRIVMVKTSPESPAGAIFTFNIEYLRYTGETTLDGRLNTLGYETTVTNHEYYSDPEGTSDLKLVFNDMSASFTLAFKDIVEFSVELHTPLSVDLSFYELTPKLDFGDSIISVTHGQLYLDSYDPVSEGILAIVDHISAQDDFVVDCRADVTSDHIDVHGSDGSVIDTIKRINFSVKEIYVMMIHDDYLQADIDKIYIEYITKDGLLVERELKHLDVDKDYKDPSPKHDVLVYTSEIMLISFGIVAGELLLVLIVLRIKRPDMFRFGQERF